MCNEYESKQEEQEIRNKEGCCCGCVGFEEKTLRIELPDEE